MEQACISQRPSMSFLLVTQGMPRMASRSTCLLKTSPLFNTVLLSPDLTGCLHDPTDFHECLCYHIWFYMIGKELSVPFRLCSLWRQVPLCAFLPSASPKLHIVGSIWPVKCMGSGAYACLYQGFPSLISKPASLQLEGSSQCLPVAGTGVFLGESWLLLCEGFPVRHHAQVTRSHSELPTVPPAPLSLCLWRLPTLGAHPRNHSLSQVLRRSSLLQARLKFELPSPSPFLREFSFLTSLHIF